MAVLGSLWFALEVPDLEAGVGFYERAGLIAQRDGATATLSCAGQDRPSVILIGGAPHKRLHHIALRADKLDEIAERAGPGGGEVVAAPAGMEDNSLWLRDPHGLLIRLIDRPADPPLSASEPYAINAPGRVVRIRRPAMRSRGAYSGARPLKLGHVLTFSPDVLRSAAFCQEVLGMGLADRSGDVIAFCCARRNSDHHMLAFAKSGGVGFHHASFQVADPDEVGRYGRILADAEGRGDWGFGRHAIGSNFFHYVKDPWGSWFEYYADMDHIDDHDQWTPTDYPPEDSLLSWGPNPPPDFVVNHELEAA